MKQTTERVTLWVLAVATFVLTLSALWLSVASSAQLGQISRVIFVGGGAFYIFYLFLTGVTVGWILCQRRTRGASGSGNDERGKPRPPSPDPGFDAMEEELQRLITEARSSAGLRTPLVSAPATLGCATPTARQGPAHA